MADTLSPTSLRVLVAASEAYLELTETLDMSQSVQARSAISSSILEAKLVVGDA